MKSRPTPSSTERASLAAAVLAAVLLVAVAAVGAQPGPVTGERLEFDEEENPFAGVEAFSERRAGSASGGVHPYVAARAQALRMLSAGTAPGASEREWTALGPGNVGGRVRALVVDPSNTDVLYAGGVAGGVWKSADAGESWVPLTDTFANVSVSSIAMDPRDPNVLYVGTGELFSTRPEFLLKGIGIMKTTDGGATWQLLDDTVGDTDFQVVHDIVISASDSDLLYAATFAGVARSTDGGDTWETVHKAESASGCAELALRTDASPAVLLASCADAGPDGVYRSDDGGDSWTKVIDEVNGVRAGRAAIAFAPGDQDIAYASVARTEDDPRGASGTLALLRSDDGGQSWSVENNGTANWIGYCGDAMGFGYYATAVAVDPTDADRVWLGGVDVFRSDNGGRTITIASYWQLIPYTAPPSQGLHADQHAIVFDPGYDGTDNQTVYFANDGGVYRTRNALAPLPDPDCARLYDPRDNEVRNEVLYEPLNDGLAITQFWAGTVSDDGTVLMGGSQDNGTWVRPRGADEDGWVWVIGGDGFDVAVTPKKSVYYGEIYGDQGIDIWRSMNGEPFEPITQTVPPSLNDSGGFFTPFVLDPANPSTLWTGGHYMWRTRDGGDVWVQASERLTSGANVMSAIAIAPSDTDVVYAGSMAGELWVTTNSSARPPRWTELPTQDGLIMSIAVHPEDPEIAYVTTGLFGVPHVLKTTDGGESWTDLSDDLPDVPASAVAINPLDPDMVFVGTDAGLFESPDGGATWFAANGDLVSTIVQDLVFRRGTSELCVFTHGRGAYRVDVGTGKFEQKKR